MKLKIDGTVYDFDQDRLMLSEAMAVQVATGMKVPQWQKALGEMDAYALGALVWLLRRRAGETDLRFEDVDFNLADLEDVSEEEPDPTAAAPAA